MAPRLSRRSLIVAPVALAAGALAGPAPAGAAPTRAPVDTYATTINGDPADVYHPRTSGTRACWPVVLLLQGANVDRSSYASFARQVAAYGFVVAVPDHLRTIAGQTGLFVDGAQAGWTVTWAAGENTRADSLLRGRIDADTLLLTGHSFGGAAGIGLSTGLSTPPFTDAPVPAPTQLRAAAFYGASFTTPGAPAIPPIANRIPVALIQGSVDGVGSPANGRGTYNALVSPPKLYVSVTGANHYGITDTQNPAGARPDPVPQTLDQATAVRTVARWTALWFRAQLGDPAGRAWVYGFGDAVDPGVTTDAVRATDYSLIY